MGKVGTALCKPAVGAVATAMPLARTPVMREVGASPSGQRGWFGSVMVNWKALVADHVRADLRHVSCPVVPVQHQVVRIGSSHPVSTKAGRIPAFRRAGALPSTGTLDALTASARRPPRSGRSEPFYIYNSRLTERSNLSTQTEAPDPALRPLRSRRQFPAPHRYTSSTARAFRP